MNKQQTKALETIKKKWAFVGVPYYHSLNKCYMVSVSQEQNTPSTWLGIESDGHCHSQL